MNSLKHSYSNIRAQRDIHSRKKYFHSRDSKTTFGPVIASLQAQHGIKKSAFESMLKIASTNESNQERKEVTLALERSDVFKSSHNLAAREAHETEL
jgi:hypothetical protein